MQAFEQLEVSWAEFNDLDPTGMVACSSGSAALHLALEAFQLPQGSEVVVPDFTMVACPRAVVMAGLVPVFVDCGDDLNMNLMHFRDALARREVTAAMIVHIYGRRWKHMEVFDNAAVTEKATRKCFLIEDLAEAHGVKPHPNTDAACWSFYRTKIVGGEEGGAVWFKDKKHANLARLLRCQGFTEKHDFTHVPRGHNYRLANCLASKISYNLLYAEQNLHNRREIEGWYDKHCPPEWKMPLRGVVWVYDLRIPGLATMGGQENSYDNLDMVVGALRSEGIEARHSFKPCSRQAEWVGDRRVKCYGTGNAARLSKECLYLPVTPGRMTEEDCRKPFGVIRRVLGSD